MSAEAEGGGGIESPVLLHSLFPHVSPIIIMTVLVFAGLILTAWVTNRRLKMVPSGAQNFFEFIYEFWYEMGESLMGHEIRRFMPLFMTLFLFILFGNLIGLVPGFMSPTSSLNTTFALSLIVFFSTHIFGIAKKGPLGYLGHFWKKGPFIISLFIFFIEIMGELVRPISLAARLFGNILAKEIVLAVLILLVLIFLPSTDWIAKSLAIFPLILRPLIIVLGTLVSLVQASVFTILAMIYIGGAVSEQHGH